MATLQAPDGTHYETDNDAEVRNLTLGHGYRVLTDDSDQTGQQPNAQPEAPVLPVEPQTPEPPEPASDPAAPTPDTPAF